MLVVVAYLPRGETLKLFMCCFHAYCILIACHESLFFCSIIHSIASNLIYAGIAVDLAQKGQNILSNSVPGIRDVIE